LKKKNGITKKTTRQEESPEKEQKKTQPAFSSVFVCFLFLFVSFLFCFSEPPYILCAAGLSRTNCRQSLGRAAAHLGDMDEPGSRPIR
jgi:hypothetical protein